MRILHGDVRAQSERRGKERGPARRGGAGTLELIETSRSQTVAEGISEGFRPAASARVAPRGRRRL